MERLEGRNIWSLRHPRSGGGAVNLHSASAKEDKRGVDDNKGEEELMRAGGVERNVAPEMSASPEAVEWHHVPHPQMEE
jgi:hypothetical protein